MHFFLVALLTVVYTGFFLSSGVQAQTTKIKGNDVLVNGDSFFAMSGEIKKFLEKHAREDGVIAQSESFRNAAVSGAVLTAIMNQYQQVNPKPIYVIQDAGGNDCLFGTPDNAKNNCQAFLDKMKAGGTKKVLWMRYPEPMGTGRESLKKNLDALMPEIEKMCKASRDPQVLWVDLRPVWGSTQSYTTDGIHPTTAGSQATADAFWKAIKDSNFFDIATQVKPFTIIKTAPSTFIGRTVANNSVFLSFFLSQPSAVIMRIMTISGQTVATKMKGETTGFRNVEFPYGTIAPGVYSLEVHTSQFLERSTLFLR
jgi:lysophospholipase L1-like esterase